MNKPLTNTCNSCGNMLSAGVKFCGKCGTKVVAVNKVFQTNEIKSTKLDTKKTVKDNKKIENASDSNKKTEWYWHKGKWQSHQVEKTLLNDLKPLNKSKSSYFTWFLIILFVIIYSNIDSIKELITSSFGYVDYEKNKKSQSEDSIYLDELDKILDSEIKPKEVKKSIPKLKSNTEEVKKSIPKPKSNTKEVKKSILKPKSITKKESKPKLNSGTITNKVKKEVISTTNLDLRGIILKYSYVLESNGDTINISLKGVKVENLTTGNKTRTNSYGQFDIKVNLGDDLIFTKRGLESVYFKIYKSTILYHIEKKNKFYITLLDKGSKLGKYLLE